MLLDIRMPDMDGLTLQARLGEAGSKVPIIFMTAIEDGTTEGRALTAGATAFLYKPIDEVELLGAVRNAIDAR